MPYLRFSAAPALVVMLLGLFDAPVVSLQPSSAPELAWVSRRDLTNSEFAQYFEEYRKRGYIITDVDAYPGGGGTLFSMIWHENRDGRAWAEWRNLTSDEYHKRWEEYRDKGYRPSDVEAYASGGQTLFAGIWIENREKLQWYSYRGLDAAEYQTHYLDKSARGFRLVDMDGYQTPAGLRYNVIWWENTDKIDWRHHRDLTREAYQQRIDELTAAGFIVVDFESYTAPGGQRYAAIWHRNTGKYAFAVRSDRSETEFANYWRLYRDQGLRPVDFERYQTSSGTRYAGVWLENNARYRYARKGQLDDAVEKYRAANNVPGISVAVIRDGQTIYRRGFGFADVNAQKQAHGETVYLAASVSKVIGGTLAAKLENEGRLRDGTTVTLNLDNTTRTYLGDMPAAHSHTVRQLLSHLGCVWHYSTGPEPPGGFYATALAAARTIWNTRPLAGCTMGVNRNYSTHAQTFVGAVLEDVTGRPIDRLVRDEIAVPYGLDSMRAQFETSSLPSNYERAVPYNDSGGATSYSDNSWKVLGGGIEIDAVDLARFGWRTLNGDIVAAAARDNRLWTRVRADAANGIAWEVRTIGGRRVAEHGGSWTGARSHLRVYRDNGLVIAILSNKDGHSPQDLATTLGNLVLNP